ncbi:MAG: helix-turn-helix transcriptional regulator, partial [Proteobacteria bacterium]|nr:helix-turn-helix transcriptional regulator [Pseudomonadota bacterium]
LTKREIDVIKCILQGYSAKKVGLSLGISFRTVESYINMIKLKLKCSRKSELIELCMRSGLYKVFF